MANRGSKRISSLRKRLAEARSRRKGRKQQEAAERGKALPFYIKEVAKKALNPFRKPRP